MTCDGGLLLNRDGTEGIRISRPRVKDLPLHELAMRVANVPISISVRSSILKG